MIQSFRFWLTSHQRLTGTRWIGEDTHGLLFRLLGELAPDRGDLFHAADPKPFSLAVLVEDAVGLGFCVKGLTDEMIHVLRQLAAVWRGRSYTVRRVPLTGARVLADAPVTHRELWALAAKGRDRITLRFQSPTSFRSQGMQRLFPTPELVFGSLLRRWEAFAPDFLPPPVVAEVLPEIRVSGY